MKPLLSEYGIVHQLTAVQSPQMNGVAERVNRTLLESTRAQLFHANIPITFWPEALRNAAYIRNLIPHKSLPGGQLHMKSGLERSPNMAI